MFNKFSCEGEMGSAVISRLEVGMPMVRHGESYGISKHEELVSDFYGADGMRKVVNEA